MTPKTFRLFIKPGCPWCVDAEEWLQSRGWNYETLDVTNNRSHRAELLELTGQTKARGFESPSLRHGDRFRRSSRTAAGNPRAGRCRSRQ